MHLWSKKFIPPALLVSAICAFAAPPDLSKCVQFKLPSQKAVINSPLCTLGIDSSCKKVARTGIRVRYIPASADTAVEVTLSGRYYPAMPSTYVWNMDTVPNQLFFGLGVIIDVAFADGTISSKRREGIFLAHRTISYPVEAKINYEVPGTRAFPKDTLKIPSSSVFAGAQLYWNEKNLSIRATVVDRGFSSAAPVSQLQQMGLEICLDPAHRQKPYPTEEVLVLMVPLSGKPYRISYRPFFSDSGGYEPNATSARVNFDYSIEQKDGQGYTVTVHVPAYILGKTIPREMGINLTVKTLNDEGKIVSSSWINASGLDNHCPLLWGAAEVTPKPVFKARLIIWMAFFLAGLLIPIIIHFIMAALVKDRPKVLYIKHTKEEKALFERAKETIDRLITNKNMAIQDIAKEIQLPPARLEKVIRKVTGIPYRRYIDYLRTEIVCERLRSSHSAVEAIAESCGFENAKVMARVFKKYHHLTPAGYRKAQQITK